MTYRWVSDVRLQRAQICLLILACIWGSDYLMTQPRGSLNVVEHIIPLVPCGMLFLFCGVMGIIGELWMEVGRAHDSSQIGVPMICRSENRWWPSFTAHACLCGIYLGLTAGHLMEMVVHGHIWGMRTPAVMFAFAAMHFVFIQKRKRNAIP